MRVTVLLKWLRKNALWLAFGLLLLLVVAILVFFGHKVESGSGTFSTPSGGGFFSWNRYEHGWPLVFLQRSVSDDRVGGWRLFEGVSAFHPASFLLDLGVLVGAPVLITMLLRAWLARRRWYQFSLASLLMLTTAIAGMFAWWEVQKNAYEREAAICTRLEENGHWLEAALPESNWLRTLLTEERLTPLQRVTGIRFSPETTDEQLAAALEHIRNLDGCRDLDLGDTQISDRGLRLLTTLESIDSLSLAYTKVTEAGVRSLRGRRDLRKLDLEGTQVGNGALAAIASLSELEDLRLANTGITDQGMQHLAQLKRLTFLDVSENEIGPGALEYVQDLPRLEVLFVAGTNVPEEVLERLQRDHPEWSVEY